jgi:hypothetical protein
LRAAAIITVMSGLITLIRGLSSRFHTAIEVALAYFSLQR